MSQIKVPPTGQHAGNHVNEPMQEAAGSAPLWRQIGELDGERRRPTILQETHRAIDCKQAQFLIEGFHFNKIFLFFILS